MQNLPIGVVGDDVTGCNDIAVMYAKAGLSANVFAHTAWEGAQAHPSDVLVLDTDSRFIAPEQAYRRVYHATLHLRELGARRYYKKTCSVFRGNIGVEFDAMLDALQESFAVVVLGFPDNGRTTVDGVHYVRGVRLEESEFRNDPMNPMTQSNLVEILQSQTKRKVSLLDWREVERGAPHLEQAIHACAQEGGYVIVDVRDNADLAIIAQATRSVRVMCGASAVAFQQGKRLKHGQTKPMQLPPYHPELGILSISGSLMPQTRAQIACAIAHGVFAQAIPVDRLLTERERVCETLARQAEEQIMAGKDVLIYSDHDPGTIAAAKRMAQQQGVDSHTLAKLVSQSLAQICQEVLAHTGQNRVLVAGGDTSGSFCERMGIAGMSVYEEIESGLPSSVSLSDLPLFVVLKSGSFGKEDFFIRAYEHLKKA